ncbi:cytochrome P450 4V2-like [Macrosteles quadrilineatus]|uniref:cytochrome P450 4V2-like n=1 Tax=Macrosteles quadrilineatus TaxID=74068 RepID=UPI0023E2653B|nr:cytochrome P450 4V2-like [Macrosteles quadrilineatus]
MLSVVLTAVSATLTYSLVVLVGLLLWFQWRHRDLIRAAYSMPTVLPTLPIIGHAHLTIMGLDKMTEAALQFSRQAVAKGISIACFWCGPLPVFVVHGLEDIQTVLKCSHVLHKPTELTCLEKFFGFGLLTAPVEVWKVTRRYLNHLFHPRNLDQMMPTFNRNSQELVGELCRHEGNSQVDVQSYTMHTALKTVCHLVFGPDVEFDTKSESFEGLMKVVERIPHFFTIRAVRPWLRIDTLFYFLYQRDLEEVDRLYKNFTEAPLKETRVKNELKNKLAEQESADGKVSFTGPKNLVEVYATMQENFPQFTEEHLKTEMVTMYGTGTDTTGTALASCLLTLAQYQDIQERLYQEIISVVGTDSDVTAKDLQSMTYLDQVYKETLRWFTISHFALRKTSEDIKLSSCTIPANNTVCISLGGLLMNPHIFQNPEKFDPDRFSPKNAFGKERFAFLPFSGGPRNCIGQMYANMLIKVAIIHVMRRFKLSTDMNIHTMKRVLSVLLVSTEGYNIKFQRRR